MCPSARAADRIAFPARLVSSRRVSPSSPAFARALLVALACAGCGTPDDPVHPSYDPCVAPEPCGLSTTCERVALTATGAAASLCTRACALDADCPGFSARCVMAPTDGGAPSGQCYRECTADLDCRAGTACHALRLGGALTGLCVPDTGRRGCRTRADCAPFEDICDLSDAGASPFDASAASGRCRYGTAEP